MNSINYNDYIITDKLSDTIERLEFSQNSNNPYFLSAGGWDGKFYLWNINLQKISNIRLTDLSEFPPYEIQNTDNIITYNLEDPIFSLCWKQNTNLIFAGTVEGALIHIDLESSRFQKCFQFDSGIREILHFQDNNFDLIITGTYDGIIRLWDIRDLSAPVKYYDTNNTINSMCIDNYLLIVGMHNGYICYFDLRKLRQGNFEPEIIFESNFVNLLPIYSLCAFPDMEGFACVCLEGKVSINIMDINNPPKLNKENKKLENPSNLNFIFRAHRKMDGAESCMINQIKINKPYGTFATCGGDGMYSIWDYISKSRLKIGNFPGNPPITSLNFSMDGNIISYACGDDWSEGHAQMRKIETKIALRVLSDSEKKKKPEEKKS